MLVDLHVEMAPPILLDPFVLAGTDTEERELAIHVTVAQSLAEEPRVVADPEARMLRRWQHTAEFVAEGIVDELIGIEKEDPWRGWCVVTQEPIALLWEAAIPREVDDFGTMVERDGPRPIGARRIDHDDTLETPQPCQA